MEKEILDRVYRRYPKKVGKAEGMKRALRLIRTPDDLVALERALDRFLAYHARVQTEPQYLPYFSSFMSSWTDWLDEDAGVVESPARRGIEELLKE